MSWNYRIIEHEDCFGIHEIYYKEDGSLELYTQKPAFVWDKDSSMQAVIDMMKRAEQKPILQYADLPSE